MPAKKKRGPGRPPGSKNKPKKPVAKAAAKRKPVKAKSKPRAVVAAPVAKRQQLAPLPTFSASDLARIEREMFNVDTPSDTPGNDFGFADGTEVNETPMTRDALLSEMGQSRARFEILVTRLKQLESAFIELASLVKNSGSSLGGFGTPRGF